MKSRIAENLVQYLGPLIALVVMGFINLYLYFILMITAFGLFDCGEDVNEWYDVRTAFIGAVVLFTAQSGITYLLRKARLYFWAFVIPTTASFVVTLYFGFCLGNYGHYYQDFDQVGWKSSEYKPMSMARTISEDKRYLGKTKERVLTELGQPRREYAGKLYYMTDQYSDLVFEFNGDKVSNYYLYCDD